MRAHDTGVCPPTKRVSSRRGPTFHGGLLFGTNGGVVLVPPAERRSQNVFHSTDGRQWTQGELVVPREIDPVPQRWGVRAVEKVGDVWIAIAEVSRLGADPVLYVWTSADGVEWTPQGIPRFGVVDGRAVVADLVAVAGDWLIVAPAHVTVAEIDGATVASGAVIQTGSAWATDDGREWTRVLETNGEIVALAGTTTQDGRTIGLWIGQAARDPKEVDASVTPTTARPVNPLNVDPLGTDLQDEMLADGQVTLAEFTAALEGWKTCMEQRGYTDVSFEIEPTGGFSQSFSSVDGRTGETDDAACNASFVARVAHAIP